MVRNESMKNLVLIVQFISCIITMYFMTKSIIANRDYECDYYEYTCTLSGIVTILLWIIYGCFK